MITAQRARDLFFSEVSFRSVELSNKHFLNQNKDGIRLLPSGPALARDWGAVPHMDLGSGWSAGVPALARTDLYFFGAGAGLLRDLGSVADHIPTLSASSNNYLVP